MKSPLSSSVLVACLIVSVFANASAFTTTVEARAKETIIPDLVLDHASPTDALNFISTTSGIKIFYKPTSSDKSTLTMSIKNIPADAALKYVAKLAQLRIDYKADGVHVEAISGAVAPPSEAEPLLTKTFDMRSTTINQAKRKVAGPRGSVSDRDLIVRYLTQNNVKIQLALLKKDKLIVRATRADLDKISQLLTQLSSGGP